MNNTLLKNNKPERERERERERSNNLYNFIDFINNITSIKQNGNKGEEFENLIKGKLKNSGFNEASFNKKKKSLFIDNFFHNSLPKKQIDKNIEIIKNKVLDKKKIETIKNPFNDFYKGDIFIYQPFGSQNFPDFFNNY